MIIYGVALLSVSLILGMLTGEALGVILGVDANAGGVGIAMLFLVFASNSASFRALTAGRWRGHQILSAMYIPIVEQWPSNRMLLPLLMEACCPDRRNGGGFCKFCSSSCHQPLGRQ